MVKVDELSAVGAGTLWFVPLLDGRLSSAGVALVVLAVVADAELDIA